MNIYQNRLDTFRSSQGQWPHSKTGALKIENFAKAGFFLCKKRRHNDNVKCFLCDIELSSWTSQQSPFIRHASESSSCSLVLLNYPDSRLLTAGSGTTWPNSIIMKKARTHTFTTKNYWPPKNIGNVQKPRLSSTADMVEAGFYYSPTLEHPFRIRCPYCHFSIIQPDLDTNLLNVHKQTKSQCPFFHKEPNGIMMNKRRKISESSHEENNHKKKESVFNSDIWDFKKAFPVSKPKVLTTFSKRKKKGKPRSSDEFSPLLVFPEHQENILTDEAFNLFDTNPIDSDDSKSQEGKEKEGSNQQSIVKNKPRHSSTHNEESKQMPRVDKAPRKITVISSPDNQAQERTIPISPFRQARISRPSNKLSSGPSFSSKKDSLSRKRPSSSSSSKKDSLPKKRPITPSSPPTNAQNRRPFLMQSTPSQSAGPPGELALFGSYSPIAGNGPMGGLGAFGGSSTPLPSSSRTHKLINSENQLKKFKRPVSPTRPDSEPTDMMQPLETSVEAVCNILYQDELTEQEKKLTVAEFIHQNIEKRIRMIEEHGEKRIQEVKRRAEELKQQIRDSSS